MILRRLAEAIREQNWFTVVLEVLIVVVGIFIGLQVDDWNEARKDRALELQYLIRLHQDIQSDIDNFRELERIFEIKASIAKDLRDQTVATLLEREPKDLMRDLVFSSYVALPAIQSATFDELSSTGRLALIQDVTLLGALSNYYTGFQHISAIRTDPVGEYRKILYEALPGELNYEWRLSNSFEDLENLRAGLEVLHSDPRLRPAANAAITYSTSLIFYLRQYRQDAEQLLALLKVNPAEEQR